MSDRTPNTPLESLLADRAWVRGLARGLVRDENRADDLEQQAWLAALTSPPKDDRSPRGWIATVLRRAAGKERRTTYRRDQRERIAARPEAQPSASDVVSQAEWHGRVVEAVLSLVEPYRTTILLRYFEDLPPREVAARMGAPVETVRSRAQRGLALLRAKFDVTHGERRAWAIPLLQLATGGDAPPPGSDSWDEPTPHAPPLGVPDAAGLSTAATSGFFGARGLWAAAVLVAAAGGVLWLRDRGGVPDWGSEAASVEAVGEPSAAAVEGDGPTPSDLEALPKPSGLFVASHPASIRGRVTRASDGTPVVGARVRAVAFQSVNETAPLPETRTDSEGRYSLAGVPGREAMVLATAPGLIAKGAGGVRPEGYNPLAVMLVPGGTATLDLVLVSACIATGRVLGPHGEPIRGAIVTARVPMSQARGVSRVSLPGETAVTGEQGTYRLDTLSGGSTYLLTATASGWIPAKAGPFRTEPGGSLTENLRFEPVRFVDVVVQETGTHQGVGSAYVEAVRTLEGGSFVDFRSEWATSAKGHARVGPLPMSPLWLTASAAGFRDTVTPSSANLSATAESLLLELTRASDVAEGPESPTLRVRVIDPNGRPIPAALAMAWRGDNWGSSAVIDGFAELGWISPRAGYIEVFGVTDGQGRSLPYGAGWVPVGDLRDLEVRLRPEKLIGGSVVDEAGRGILGARVRAVPSRWEDHPRLAAMEHAAAWTDTGGAFHLAGLGDEQYVLRVEGPPDLVEGAPTRIAAGTLNAQIVLRAGVIVSVKARDRSGMGVPEVRVMARLESTEDPRSGPLGEGAAYGTTDGRGSVTLTGLDPRAAYTLSLVPPRERGDLITKSVAAWSPAGSEVEFDIDGAVSGTARDARGRPAAGANVLAVGAGDSRVVVRTDSNGRFRFNGLTNSSVSFLVAYADGDRAPELNSSASRMARPGDGEVALVLFPGAELVVRLDGTQSGWIDAVAVSEGPTAGTYGPIRGKFAEGTLRFVGADLDTPYRIRVRRQDGSGAGLFEGVRAGEEATLALAPGSTISGRIKVPAGWSDVSVIAYCDFLLAQGVVGPDGTYEIRGLTSGTYDVRATAKGPEEAGGERREYVANFQVAAGAVLNVDFK